MISYPSQDAERDEDHGLEALGSCCSASLVDAERFGRDEEDSWAGVHDNLRRK